ncbi:MAG TPA: hypothetical protein VMM83_05040 [Longimicrobiales bacterium]|nr:hypothetical protein [Longimicrobiales bacterium]
MGRLYGPGPEDPPPLISSGDLAGLSTTDVEDRPVGSLFGSLAEVETGLIRYLDISLHGGSRHVLVPIGHARIDRDAVPPRVRLRAATYEDLMQIPTFEGNGTTVDRDYQDRLMDAHGRLFYGSRYYAHPAYDHRGLQAGDRTLTGPSEAAPAPALRPLGELKEFQVSDPRKDIRGWGVVDRRGEHVAEVIELLADVVARQVRYVVLALDEPKRQAALPVGYVEIDGEAREVLTPTLTRDDLRLLPPYQAPITRQDENRILATLEGRLTGERYYHRPDFRRG